MPLDRDFLEYSGLDSACTLQIYEEFWDGLSPTFSRAYDLTIRLFPVLMFMQSRGIQVSKALLDETKADVIRSAAEKQRELDALIGRSFNVNSPKQCQEYFYTELGYGPYRNAEGRLTVDDMALQRLVRGTVGKPGLRAAKRVQDVRGLNKLYGTYLGLEFDADGRIRCSFNPRGTKFGRLSSSKTIFGTGTNFQNLPQEFKKFLVPDEGFCFIEVDKRQAEWVVVAYVAGDANMIAAVEGGIDVHTYTACQMFEVPPEVVKVDHKLCGHITDADTIKELRMSDPLLRQHYKSTWPRSMSLRQCGKKSNHGLNYDEGYRGFALINEMDEGEAKRVYTFYHNIYPGIKRWYEATKYALQKNRTLTNYFGRAVRFLGAWNDKLWKAAYSMIPQSTVVDSRNEGMVRIYEDEWLTRALNGDILAQVHDSILMQFPIKWLEDKHIFDTLMAKVTYYTSPDIEYNGKRFKIASDYKVGLNWGGGHPEHNPQGMVDVSNHEEFMEILKGWNNVPRAEKLD